MTALKITGMTELATSPATGDLMEVVDIDDTTMAATGTNKKITIANLIGATDTQIVYSNAGVPAGALFTYNNSSGSEALGLKTSAAAAFPIDIEDSGGNRSTHGAFGEFYPLCIGTDTNTLKPFVGFATYRDGSNYVFAREVDVGDYCAAIDFDPGSDFDVILRISDAAATGAGENATMNAVMTWHNSLVTESHGSITIGDSSNAVTVNGSAITFSELIHSDGVSKVGDIGAVRYSTVAGLPAQFAFGRAKGSLASPAVVADNDSIGRLSFSGWDGTDFATAATINVEVDGTPGSDDMPGRITFNVSPDGSQTVAEAMRITQAGRVGIGATSPVALLDVNGGVALPTTAIDVDDTPYSALITDYTILADCSSGAGSPAAITVNLPAVATSTGLILVVKKIDSDASTVTIDGNGAETIDGAATQVLAVQYDALMMQCDGSTWHII